MTEQPPVELPDGAIDTDRAVELRYMLVDYLVSIRTLNDEPWITAFLEVPRHVLVPGYHEIGGARIDAENDPETWLQQVYSDVTLITQRQNGVPTSSSTMPSLVATMLEALDVQDGDRVLQVGTGTGYTAALLCERLAAERVTTVDVDPALTDLAAERLFRLGYLPTIITADGTRGYLRYAPYDRCLATVRVDRVPPAWVEQTRRGGVIVAPVYTGIARLTVTGPNRAEGPFIGAGYFVGTRAIAAPSADHPPAPACEVAPAGPERVSDLPNTIYYDDDFQFVLAFTLPGLTHAYHDGNQLDLTLTSPEGSTAHITPEGRVTQTGNRRLWDEVQRVYRTWESLGTPTRQRFGLTVTDTEQHVWLDEPNGPLRWITAR